MWCRVGSVHIFYDLSSMLSVNRIAKFICICPVGYEGDMCEILNVSLAMLLEFGFKLN